MVSEVIRIMKTNGSLRPTNMWYLSLHPRSLVCLFTYWILNAIIHTTHFNKHSIAAHRQTNRKMCEYLYTHTHTKDTECAAMSCESSAVTKQKQQMSCFNSMWIFHHIKQYNAMEFLYRKIKSYHGSNDRIKSYYIFFFNCIKHI